MNIKIPTPPLSNDCPQSPSCRGDRPVAPTVGAGALALLLAGLAALTAPAGANAQTAGICGRTAQVQTEIINRISGRPACADVTPAHLAGISGELDLRSRGIAALQAGDFAGLSNLRTLDLSIQRIPGRPDNRLTALPAGLLAGLSNLRNLSLNSNQLTDLPAGLLAGLGNLEFLGLADNQLTALPAGLLAGLGNLRTLNLAGTNCAACPPACSPASATCGR